MGVGLCCMYVEEIKKKDKIEIKNIFEEKHLLFSKINSYPKERVISTWKSNISNVIFGLDKVIQDGIKCFRLSSSLFPFYDIYHEDLVNNKEILDLLDVLGKKILSNNIRLTMHPSEWVIINSKSIDVVKKSINDLEHHAWIMDSMNLPKNNYYTIMIHGGIKNNLKQIIDIVNILPLNIKSRLAFENDELSYNVKDLYKVYEETKCPIVFDSHHHSFNDGNIKAQEAFEISLSTWNVKGLNHLSNTEIGFENGSFQERRKHSNYVHYIPEYQLEANNSDKIDLEFEFKAKQLAIIKAVKDFNIKL